MGRSRTWRTDGSRAGQDVRSKSDRRVGSTACDGQSASRQIARREPQGRGPMNLQTFKAPTMAEALTQVKSAMGADAIILHTRTFASRALAGPAAAWRWWRSPPARAERRPPPPAREPAAAAAAKRPRRRGDRSDPRTDARPAARTLAAPASPHAHGARRRRRCPAPPPRTAASSSKRPAPPAPPC